MQTQPSETIIITKIYNIRDQKVMIDFDIAALYEVETKVFNQAIKRNLESFPEDFMFRVTREELQLIKNQSVTANWSQFVTSSQKHRRGDNLPLAFTEHGVTMLASVLKSPKARQMNIAIVRAFIALRKFTIQNRELMEQITELKDRLGEHDIQLSQIYDALENMLDQKAEEKKWTDRDRIGFISENR